MLSRVAHLLRLSPEVWETHSTDETVCGSPRSIKIAGQIGTLSADAVSPITDMVCTAKRVSDRRLLDVCTWNELFVFRWLRRNDPSIGHGHYDGIGIGSRTWGRLGRHTPVDGITLDEPCSDTGYRVRSNNVTPWKRPH